MFKMRGGRMVFDDEAMIRHDPVTKFKSLWSGEEAALQTYSSCLKGLSNEALVDTASKCRDLHAANANILAEHLAKLGETVGDVDLSHQLLAFAGGLTAIAPDGTIAVVLQKMETDLLSSYMDSLTTVEAENLEVLQERILPNQHQCYDAWQAMCAA